jgi:hypothetical protein
MPLTLSLAMLCAACASNPDQVVAEVSTQTITASVAAPVSCVTSDQIPKMPAPTPVDLAKATVDQKVAALAADALAARDAASDARKLLLNCSQLPPEVKP